MGILTIAALCASTVVIITSTVAVPRGASALLQMRLKRLAIAIRLAVTSACLTDVPLGGEHAIATAIVGRAG